MDQFKESRNLVKTGKLIWQQCNGQICMCILQRSQFTAIFFADQCIRCSFLNWPSYTAGWMMKSQMNAASKRTQAPLCTLGWETERLYFGHINRHLGNGASGFDQAFELFKTNFAIGIFIQGYDSFVYNLLELLIC